MIGGALEAEKVSRTGNQASSCRSVVELFPGHWQGLASVLLKVGQLREFIHMPKIHGFVCWCVLIN